MTDTTLPADLLPDEDIVVPEEPLWRIRLRLYSDSMRKNWEIFSRNRLGVVGVVLVALFGVLAVLHPILMSTVWADQIAPNGANIYDPVKGNDTVLVEKTVVPDGEVVDSNTQLSFTEAMIFGEIFPEEGMTIKVGLAPAPPNSKHFLGTDPFGRDILSQIMKSSQAAFTLGVVAATSAVIIATLVGSVAAYYGGWIDSGLMRMADLILLLPLLPLLIVLGSFWNIGLVQLGLLIGLLSGFGATAIILKSQALSVKVKPFNDAARVAGGSNWHIITRHIIPNVLPLSFLYMMFEVTGAIFLEATLSFFGLLSIPMSWGIMINTAHTQGYTLFGLRAWWLLFPAGLSVTLFAAGFFLIGRAMDEVVNPRLRAR
jgi:peptide/nickel transport system permease protein